jgi:hypothetical protein
MPKLWTYTKLVQYAPLPVTLGESPILVQQTVTKISFFVPMRQHKGEGHYSFCFVIYFLFVFKGNPVVHETDIINHWLNQLVNADGHRVRDAEHVHYYMKLPGCCGTEHRNRNRTIVFHCMIYIHSSGISFAIGSVLPISW